MYRPELSHLVWESSDPSLCIVIIYSNVNEFRLNRQLAGADTPLIRHGFKCLSGSFVEQVVRFAVSITGSHPQIDLGYRLVVSEIR